MPRYRVTRSCIVRAQASTFAPELQRLRKGGVFDGHPAADRAWVVRTLGGYVERARCAPIAGPEQMEQQLQYTHSQDVYLAAIDRFSAAISAIAKRVPKAERDELRDATGDLLNAVATRATEQSLAGFSLLYDKLTEIETELEQLRDGREVNG
jgi:hypothetical protein